MRQRSAWTSLHIRRILPISRARALTFEGYEGFIGGWMRLKNSNSRPEFQVRAVLPPVGSQNRMISTSVSHTRLPLDVLPCRQHNGLAEPESSRDCHRVLVLRGNRPAADDSQ